MKNAVSYMWDVTVIVENLNFGEVQNFPPIENALI